MKKLLCVLGLTTLAACQAALSPAAIAQTATYPTPGPGDPRIKEFMYDPNAIVGIRGQLGYELTIEFGTDERIENVYTLRVMNTDEQAHPLVAGAAEDSVRARAAVDHIIARAAFQRIGTG